jgi:hypothetical protein
MSKTYWEKNNTNKCPNKPIIGNESIDGTIVVGRQLSDGLNEQERLKLANIEHNAQVNIIETISVNSIQQKPDESKNVDLFVPTKVSQLENDRNFIDTITPEQIKVAIGGEVSFKSDFLITEEQWNTFNWELKSPEIENPSEELETEEDN